MSREPRLSHADILDALHREYGLPLTRLTSLNAGTAHAYRADGPAGRYFLKLLPGGAYGEAMLRRVQAEVPLLQALRQEGVLDHLPRPLLTRSGQALSRVGPFPLLVTEWIEARTLEGDWAAALEDLAGLLGRLHAGTARVTRHLNHLPVPPEDFTLPFEAQLTQNLHHLRARPPGGRDGARALQTLLAPHHATLDALLEQAARFGQAARQARRPHVLCHTDAHGWNVMRGAGGQLWLIDWETARLAPPEHDLALLGEHLPRVLPAYEAARGARTPLHQETLCFYSARRVLEDLAVDVQFLLHDHTRPAEDAPTLDILEGHVLPALHRLPARLEAWRALSA